MQHATYCSIQNTLRHIRDQPRYTTPRAAHLVALVDHVLLEFGADLVDAREARRQAVELVKRTAIPQVIVVRRGKLLRDLEQIATYKNLMKIKQNAIFAQKNIRRKSQHLGVGGEAA